MVVILLQKDHMKHSVNDLMTRKEEVMIQISMMNDNFLYQKEKLIDLLKVDLRNYCLREKDLYYLERKEGYMKDYSKNIVVFDGSNN